MDEHSLREKRKDEHVKLALQTDFVSDSDFDDLFFIHRSFPEAGIKDISLKTKIGSLSLDCPIYINAMTGGSKKTEIINASLAEAARETGVAIAVGSQHAGIRNESLAGTYSVVRKKNPKGLVFANVGADVPIKFAKRAIDMLEADALQIHLNVPQELVMPEGEREFTGLLGKVEKMVEAISIPVIVKETGFGISAETLLELKNIGVHYVDLGGRGGTNFIQIENERRSKRDYSYLKEWGQSTPISLMEAQQFLNDMIIMASGGIRNPLDAAKCLTLGAKAVGIARPFLKALHSNGVTGLVEELNDWKDHLKTILLMQGSRTITELQECPIMVTKAVREWCELREINIQRLAMRKKI